MNERLKSAAVSHPALPCVSPGQKLGGGAGEERREALEEETAALAAMSDERIRERIEELGEMSFVPCPACDGNTHDGRNGTFHWTITDPWRMTCAHCGTTFPNDTYLCDSTFEVESPSGETQTYRYHRTVSGTVSFLPGRVRTFRYAFMRRQALAFARLYEETGSLEAAHKAAVILHRFAEVYPHWPVSGIDTVVPGEGKAPVGAHNFFFDPEPPYPNRSGKWSWWHYMEIPADLVTAYDLVYDSGALERVAPDAKRRIEADMFRPSVAFVDSFWPGDTTNMAGNEIGGRIVSGRVLNEPAWVHRAVDHIGRVIADGYFADGFWREGAPAYHAQITGRLEGAARLLHGYTDPAGYVDQETGERFDDFDLFGRFPILKKALTAHHVLAYPNGAVTPVHDTWAGAPMSDPPEGDGSRILPAMGHAILAIGEGQAALQAHLHFCLTDGHAHKDQLNLGLFAKGRELAADFGYTHTDLRPWCTSTLGHNTVLVDGADQASVRGETWGNLRMYEGTDQSLQVAVASSETAYSELERYERTVAVVEVGGGDAYVVDLFRVEGGAFHEWALHGAADADQELAVSVPMRSAGGSLAELVAGRLGPGDSGYAEYARVYDVATGRADSPVEAIFAYTDGGPDVRSDLPRPQLRTTYLGPLGVEIVTGMAPSIHRANRENARVDAVRTPIVLMRRRGRKLQSTFAAVHEPHVDTPFVERIDALDVREPARAGVRIRHAAGTDVILSTAGTEASAVTDELDLRGRFARARFSRVTSDGHGGEGSDSDPGASRLKRLDLLDGRSVQTSEISLRIEREMRGRITAAGDSGMRARRGPESAATGRNRAPWVETLESLPTGDLLSGRILLLRFPNGRTQGCRIASVEELDGVHRVYLRDDPGIEIVDGGTRMIAFPHWSFAHPPDFEIAGAVTIERAVNGRFRLRTTSSVFVGLAFAPDETRPAPRLVCRDDSGRTRLLEAGRVEGDKVWGRLSVAQASAPGVEVWVE